MHLSCNTTSAKQEAATSPPHLAATHRKAAAHHKQAAKHAAAARAPRKPNATTKTRSATFKIPCELRARARARIHTRTL